MVRVINPNMVYPIEGRVVLELRSHIEKLIEANKTLAETVSDLQAKLEEAYKEDALEDAEYEARIAELRERLQGIEETTITVDDILAIGTGNGTSVEEVNPIGVEDVVSEPVGV